MCIRDRYYDNDGNIVEGTAIRVARAINQINSMHQKQAILYFNDLDNDKILHLKSVIDSMDLQYVKVYAVDSKGRVVPATEGEVTFEVSGEARLIAVDNGDHMTDELFSGNHKKLHQGFVMAILRSSQTSGNVKIKASLKGLKSAEKKMTTK